MLNRVTDPVQSLGPCNSHSFRWRNQSLASVPYLPLRKILWESVTTRALCGLKYYPPMAAYGPQQAVVDNRVHGDTCGSRLSLCGSPWTSLCRTFGALSGTP